MASLVKQSSTQLALKFFLTASSDHITGLTGATPTVTIRKEGGSFASPSGTVTEIANGWYQVAGNATDTNTLGEILLHATAASADPYDGIVAEVVAFDPQAALATPTNITSGTITASTVNDKTGYSLTSAYDAAKTASQAGDAMALTSSERNSTADALLGRNVAGGSSTGRLVKEALYFLRNKWSISSGTLTVYGTDDTTSAWTATVGTDGTANPIVSNDPA